jgi:hypothetical protein
LSAPTGDALGTVTETVLAGADWFMSPLSWSDTENGSVLPTGGAV